LALSIFGIVIKVIAVATATSADSIDIRNSPVPCSNGDFKHSIMTEAAINISPATATQRANSPKSGVGHDARALPTADSSTADIKVDIHTGNGRACVNAQEAKGQSPGNYQVPKHGVPLSAAFTLEQRF
jgi:hypothetical protein